MKKTLMAAALGLTATFAMTAPAEAHFMMMYTPELAMEKAVDMDMRIAFTHPAEAGHMMDMGGINEFYALHQRGENDPQKIDFKPMLQDIVWTNPESSAPAFAISIPRKEIRSMGDYVFVMVPGYYLEKEEDCYMQQITKLVANVGGVPSNWSEPAGLPCEIVPLVKPYGMWAGNVFQGQVLSNGEPVANAEVEVEFMNHMPDLASNSMPEAGIIEYPNDALVTQVVFTDANGIFTYGIPKAGWWGFAALGVGPDTEHDGKELSQDAVIWVKAEEIK